MSVRDDWMAHFSEQIAVAGDPAQACYAALISGLHIGLRDPDKGRLMLALIEADWAEREGLAPEQIESRMREWSS